MAAMGRRRGQQDKRDSRAQPSRKPLLFDSARGDSAAVCSDGDRAEPGALLWRAELLGHRRSRPRLSRSPRVPRVEARTAEPW